MTKEEKEIASRLNLLEMSIKNIEEVLRCNFPNVDNENLREQVNDLWERKYLWEKAALMEKIYANS
jgi:hypothetical protein